jgi:hypothetical protein
VGFGQVIFLAEEMCEGICEWYLAFFLRYPVELMFDVGQAYMDSVTLCGVITQGKNTLRHCKKMCFNFAFAKKWCLPLTGNKLPVYGKLNFCLGSLKEVMHG